MGQQKRGKRIRDKGKEAKGIGGGSIQEKGQRKNEMELGKKDVTKEKWIIKLDKGLSP